LSGILKRDGADRVTQTLNIIQKAHAGRAGQLSAPMIRVVDDLIAEGLDGDAITDVLRRTDAAALAAKVATIRLEHPERGTGEVMCDLVRSGDVPPPSVALQRAITRVNRQYRGTPTAPVEIRGDVPVRRFEGGTLTQIAINTLENAGRGKIEPYMDKRVQKFRYRGKLITLEKLIEKADEVRKEKGLQPLAVSRKGAA